MSNYYLFVTVKSFLFFIIPSIFFLWGIRDIEKRSGNKYKFWKFFIIFGSLGLAFSVFSFWHILYQIYIKNTNLVINFLLFPLPFLSFLFFLTLFFTMHIKGRNINCITTYNIEETKNACLTQFFPAIKKTLKIMAGDLNPYFYGDADIVKALDELKRRGVEIAIIFSIPKPKNETDEKVKEARKIVIDLLENKLRNFYDNLLCISPRYNGNHFMVGDRWHIRIEEKHIPWWERIGPEIGIKAWLYFWSPIFAWRLGCTFKHEYKKAISIERDKKYDLW